MAALHTDELLVAHNLTSQVMAIPSTERWVMRLFTVFSSGLGSGVTYQIVKDSDSATIWYGSTPTSLFSGFAALYDMRLVFMEGESYTVSTSSAADVGIFGFKLQVP